MLMILLKGLVLGLAIAAPVGPIGLLCIHRSLHSGFRSGLATGMGAATADAVYGTIAAFGLTSISTLLIAQQFWIRIIGGIFLLYLGIKIIFSKPAQNRGKIETKKSFMRNYISTFFLTITNPMTILSYIAVFAGLGLASQAGHHWQAITLVTGVVLGSALWWLFLSAGVTLFLHHRLNAKALHWINYLSGIIIIMLAIYALWI